MTKSSDHVLAKENCGRIFSGVSTINIPKNIKVSVNKPRWRIMVDKRTGLKFSYLSQTNNLIIDPTCVQFSKLMHGVYPVRFMRCYNAGDHFKLEQVGNGKYWKIDIKFEYTGAGTPQKNHLAELVLAIIGERGISLMHHANVTTNIMYWVYKEAYSTVTILGGLTVININGKEATRYEHFCGINPAFATKLRSWGAAVVVNTRICSTPKIADRCTV